MKMNRLMWTLQGIVLLASGGTLFWTYQGALETDWSGSSVPIQGTLLQSSAFTHDEKAPGAGRESTPRGDEKINGLIEARSDGVLRIDLSVLTFADYDPPELRSGTKVELTVDQFPPVIQGLCGERIEAQGHILATEFDGEEIQRFLLTRFPPGCCFGSMPVLDEWVEVTLPPGEEVVLSPVAVVRVTGLLQVGEKLDEAGFAESLYRVVADEVEVLY